MSWYRAGTISLTNGSTAVTGSSTDFIANSAVGEGLLAPDGKVYEIAAIVSATALTLGSAYLGSTASGQSYAIIPSQSYLRDLALQAATLVNDYQSVLDAAGAGKFGDGTLGSPGIQFSSDSNTGLRRTGTDAMALVTGGVDRITVDAAGAVAVVASLSVAGSAVPTLTSTSTLTNKTLALGSNTVSGTTAQFNTALSDGDFATLAGTETLTNKTLTSPDINGGTIDGTAIGSGTPSTGAFTTLSTTGAITSVGNVSMTATNPAVLFNTSSFQVYKQSNDIRIYTEGVDRVIVNATGTSVTGALSCTGNTTLGDAAGDTLNVANGSLRLDASGNLGLGVTPSATGGAAKSLDVGSVATLTSNPAGNTATTLTQNAYTNGTNWIYRNSSVGSALYQMTGANAGSTHVWSCSAGGTAGNTITFTQVLAVEKDKTLALQGATSATGCGIAFPATQVASSNANTLDDYEEGTWTPNQGAGLTVVGAFSSSGTYTKTGRQVTITGTLTGATSVACAAGGIISTNLPFTVGSSSNGVGGFTNQGQTASGNCVAANSGATLYGTVLPASTNLYFTTTYFV